MVEYRILIATFIGHAVDPDAVSPNFGMGAWCCSKACDSAREGANKPLTCVRLGGDEYVVLLPETNMNNVDSINQRVIQTFNEFNKNSGKVYTLSCSIGVVEYDATTPPDLNMLLRLADEAMYRCKHI